jgi:glycosyltransferase involved in cell wall biosynthesis
MYAGTLGLAHGLQTVIEAAERCRGEDLLFAIVGEGAERSALEKAARVRQLTNVQLLPLQPRSRMPALYRAADACLVSLRPLQLFDGFIPSKIFEIMASGRPILASVSGRALSLVIEAGAGLPVKQSSPMDLLASARELRSDSKRAAELGRNGRAFVEAHFDRKQLAARYLELLESLV